MIAQKQKFGLLRAFSDKAPEVPKRKPCARSKSVGDPQRNHIQYDLLDKLRLIHAEDETGNDGKRYLDNAVHNYSLIIK